MPADASAATARGRLAAQGLQRPLRSPAEAVALLVGVQAQDAAWGRWSIGLRAGAAGDRGVMQAIAGGEIVRTWAFRGTLHYLAARDADWIVPFLAPGIIAGNGRRCLELGLDDATLAASSRVIRESVDEEGPLPRARLVERLERAGIPAGGQRAPYMLQRAALEGLIRLGPGSDRDPVYAPVPPRAAGARRPSGGGTAATLASRYVAGHAPATPRDFAWWSGLPAAVAREAFASIGPVAPPTSRVSREPTVHLLPPFDDYLLGYKDRSAVLDPARARDVNAGGGAPKPSVLLDGTVVGTWSREAKRERIVVTPRLFRSLAPAEQRALEDAVARYGEFVGLPAGLA